jgi:hypothetical protein
MAGKKIRTIPVSSANPLTKDIDQAVIAVAKQIGFEVVERENQAARRNRCRALGLSVAHLQLVRNRGAQDFS